jgi:cell wall-associated NlpC family hydrolase
MTRRTPLARRAVAAAEANLGDPYALGGIGPHKWNCRGLVDHALHCARVPTKTARVGARRIEP